MKSAMHSNTGETVKLTGFGNFQLRDKAQRAGRNPKTDEEIPISARRVMTFQPSQKLKDIVVGGNYGCPVQKCSRIALPDGFSSIS